MSKISPMLQQYLDVKAQYTDCILFFRLGDFYEMFYEDAEVASQVLEITLTRKRVGGDQGDAPLCGVPYHSAESYIAKLIENGFKVAICEQIEDPKLTKGLVKRDVVRVVTPGTVTSDQMLDARNNNYLAAVYEERGVYGLAWCDVSTGELSLLQISGEGGESLLYNRISLIGANELLAICSISEPVTVTKSSSGKNEKSNTVTESSPGGTRDSRTASYSELEALLHSLTDSASITAVDVKNIGVGRESFEKMFGVSAYVSCGFDSGAACANALYGLFTYLLKTQKRQLAYMRPPVVRNFTEHMMLDRSSVRSLELTETLFDRQVRGSLLGVLDKTHTAMGGRLMKKWLKEPLREVGKIGQRLDSVDILMSHVLARNNIKEYLKSVYDIERLIGRVSYGNANARDLVALLRSAESVPEIKCEIFSLGQVADELPDDTDSVLDIKDDAEPIRPDRLLSSIAARMSDLVDVRGIISKAIVDDPPFTVREGGIIRSEYSGELDELKSSISGGQKWIAELEAKERERTGIKTLKVGFNKVFGYYIDITNANKAFVPPEYIRKQTLVNSERYITPEMKEIESVVLGAEARINEMEYDLFCGIRSELLGCLDELQRTSEAIAELDVLTSFAEVSAKNNYVKPTVDNGHVIEIERGRHPVIELSLADKVFVPNDVHIDTDSMNMLLITGPNMAGKSTYMRQTALIVLMAQAGCFVPAERAHIGVVDRLYTRIGASDNLARGESTFFVEMNELAYILNTATEKSFVVLDEIGRGTSTYDGLAIAWAVCEYLCTKRIRTMFATHYHELTSLESELSGLKNLNTETADTGSDVVFLHKIAHGPANRSYGIHVAKLAGVPREVLDDAQSKLDILEDKGEIEVAGAYETAAVHTGEGAQMSMFSFAPNPVIERLSELNLLEITPSQAFAILEELKKAAEKK